MKQFFALLFVLFVIGAKAQIVNIPDPVFKSVLINYSPRIDVNFDSEIQESEAAATLILNINAVNNIIDMTGIRSFTNLQHLSISNLQSLTFLDLNGLSNLKMLTISQMEAITSVNISGIDNLDQLNISQFPLTNIINSTGVNSKRLDINQVAVTSLDMGSFTALTDLNITQTQISSLDLINSTALIRVGIEFNPLLASLDVSGITTLRHLSCFNNNLSNLNIAGATGITNLDCSVNNLTALNFAGFNNLNTVNCSNNKITNLNIHDLPNLTFIHCADNNLNSLSFRNCPLLREFVCGNENYFTSLDLSNGLPNLVSANCINMPALTSINLANCPNLQSVSCQGTSVSSLDLSGKQFLTGVVCFNTGLTSINVTGCTALQSMELNSNQLTTLDFSSCTSLAHLGIDNNQLTYLNIKNGSTFDLANNLFRASGNPGLQYVCADENEVNSILGYFVQNGMSNVNVNSFCSFTPGGSFNSINGVLKIDVDNNGCGTADPVLPQYMVKINDGTNIGYTTTNNLGAFSFFTNVGNFSIAPQTQNPYFTVTPSSAIVNFSSAGGNIQTADFCISPNGVHNDIDVTMIPISRARPGFDATYKVIYTNKGTTTLSGNVELVFDDGKMNFILSTPLVTTQTTGLLSWVYTSLQPFETRSIDIQFNVLSPPVNNINDSLFFTCSITPLAADETPLDNSFEMEQLVTGSFDPNDKNCLEGDKIDITRVGDYVHYLVRFQNTGTDVTENVVITDILENNFNWNSLVIYQSSHPYKLKQSSGNKLEFIFEGINLPAVTVDEPGSHGFIAFKVRTAATLVLGDSIRNSAAIYFDFNLPVITNTTRSVIDSVKIIPVGIEYFKGVKQSGKSLLNWKVNCTSLQVKFNIERSTDSRNFTSLQNITASNTRCLQPFDFSDKNPASGMNYYRIKMTDIDGKITYSSVIALLNKKSGFEIVNLVPNPVTHETALLNITSAEKQTVDILVTDASGKTVLSTKQPLIAGFTQVKLNFNKLARGVYTITVNINGGVRKTLQFIKK